MRVAPGDAVAAHRGFVTLAGEGGEPCELGGKALGLARLVSGSVPVPPWFCVTTRVFEAAVEPARSSIAAALRSVDLADPRSLERASAKISATFAALPLTPEGEQAVVEAFDRELGSDAIVAVRSSCVGEDADGHSFAGQHDTILGVSRAQLLGAVRRCWASTYSARALAYRRSGNISPDSGSMAVVVQRLVRSRKSGVLVTHDPAISEREMIASAAFGLGEGVVQGQVETDTYYRDRVTGAMRKVVARKERAVVVDERQDAGATRIEPVPPGEGEAPVLGDSELDALFEMGRRIEDMCGRPQDIEWAFDPSGQLWILQARPVTSKQARRETAPERRGPEPAVGELPASVSVFSNANIVESFPGLTLPLTFSFAQRSYRAIFRAMADGVVLFPSLGSVVEPAVAKLLAHARGRVYYNMGSWYEFLSLFPGGDATRVAWERGIGIEPGGAGVRQVTGESRTRRTLRRSIAAVVFAVKVAARGARARCFVRRTRRLLGRLRQIDFVHLDAVALQRVFLRIQPELAARWAANMDSDLITAKHVETVARFVARWRIDRGHPGLANDLLSGAELASLAPVESLVALRAALEANAELAALAASRASDAELWAAVRRRPSFASFRRLAEHHLDEYGDRGPEDLKLEVPSMRDEPERLVAALRSEDAGAVPLHTAIARGSRTRADAFRTMRRALRFHPVRLALLALAVCAARAGIRQREQMRLVRTQAFGITRRLFRALGRLHAREGVLEREDDIFYLTVDEALGLADCGHVAEDPRAIVSRRRAEYAQYRAERDPPETWEARGVAAVEAASRLASPAQDGAADQRRPTSLHGMACAPGRIEGTARVVLDPRSATVRRGEVLVSAMTDPGWVFLMVNAGGLVVERGSVLSHSAIIGRELGIPTVVGVKDATRWIRSGDRVRVDGGEGIVTLFSPREHDQRGTAS